MQDDPPSFIDYFSTRRHKHTRTKKKKEKKSFTGIFAAARLDSVAIILFAKGEKKQVCELAGGGFSVLNRCSKCWDGNKFFFCGIRVCAS